MPVTYPLLGEPLVVEFMNTMYVDRDGTFDFLADVDLAHGWLNAVDHLLGARIVLNGASTEALRQLRDAIRLSNTRISSAANAESFQEAIDVINRNSSLSPRARQVLWDGTNRPTLAPWPRHESVESLLSVLAADAIDLMVGGNTGGVEICSRPDCNMWYLRQHHRRRYCNERCASADRQSRYYNRTNTKSSQARSRAVR